MAEQRKLIKLGNSSFAIALPKDWIDKSNLKKGDDIFVIPNSSGELIISAKFRKGNGDKESTINTDNRELDKINRDFITAYINGSSIFNFKGKPDTVKGKEIKKIIKSFIGCELTEEKEDKIIAKDFFNFEEVNMDHFTKRADNNIKEMFGILIDAFNKGKIGTPEIENLKEADKDINKIYFLNTRVLNMGMYNPSLATNLKLNNADLFSNWWLAFHLEHIGDGIKSTAMLVGSGRKNKESLTKALGVFSELKEIYEEAIRVFYSRDKDKAHIVMEKGKALWEKCDKITKSDDPFYSLVGEKLKDIENGIYQIIKTVLNFEK